MDCDLQDNPKYIHLLLNEWKKGNDIVFTIKEIRKHSFFKNITASIFFMIFNYLINEKLENNNNNIGSYSLISKKVAKEFAKYNDYQFHYLMVLRWLGFKKSFVNIQHENRFEGKSSYDFKRLVKHAMVGIIYQSDKLLRFGIYVGFIFSFLALISIIFITISYFFNGYQSGWASLFVLILFSTGLILMGIGILGLYLGKIFEQVKNRPQYIVDEKINFN